MTPLCTTVVSSPRAFGLIRATVNMTGNRAMVQIDIYNTNKVYHKIEKQGHTV